MKIAVLNGSPKGNLSITMQYVAFIQKKFPQHELENINISQKIEAIEKDEKTLREIIDKISESDGVLWAFPLYSLLVPSQYKRFIELVFERGHEAAFRDKYAATLSTSIHFYDHAAHNYMNGVSDDLNMKYVGSFSADMDDLLKEEGRKSLLLFAESFFGAIEAGLPTPKNYNPLVYKKLDYVPGEIRDGSFTNELVKNRPHFSRPYFSSGKKITIITDSDGKEPNLDRMVERFRKSFSSEVKLLNLNAVDIKGGCTGCIHCGFDNICAYQDGFTDFYNNEIRSADILIYAGAIKDRYLSSKWKEFFDRAFFNTHTPTLQGKQLGFIISGPLRQLPNLREILEAYAEWQHANPAGFVTDECGNPAEINALLQGFAERITRFSEQGYAKPRTFLGVGGMKIFRDDIWGRLRFVFQADYRAFKKYGIYDFPQSAVKTRAFNALMMLLTKIPPIKRAFIRKMKKLMVEPHQKIVKSK